MRVPGEGGVVRDGGRGDVYLYSLTVVTHMEKYVLVYTAHLLAINSNLCMLNIMNTFEIKTSTGIVQASTSS